jgi:hypothetical protein
MGIVRHNGLCARRVGKNLARVMRRIHLGIGGGDSPFAIDQVADPVGITRTGALGGAVCDRHLVIGVGQQFEWEIEFVHERGVTGWIVEAQAENLDAGVLECGVLVAEPATFAGSAGGIGFGIKPQQDFAPAERGKRKRLAVVPL